MLYGDVLTDLDLASVVDVHCSRGVEVTLVLTKTDDPTRSGIVAFGGEGSITSFLKKPGPDEIFSVWVNTGVYACSSALLQALPDPRPVPYDFVHHLFPRMLAMGRKIVGYPTPARVFDVGSPGCLRLASEAFLSSELRFSTEVTGC